MPKKNYDEKRDRLWGFILYGSEQHILRNLKDAEENQLKDIPKNKWDAVKEQNRKQRIKDGLPVKIEMTPELIRTESFLNDDIQKMLIGKGSQKDFEEAMNIFGELLAKIYVEKGKTLETNRKRVGKVSYPDEKAYLVTERSLEAKGTHMEETLNVIKQQILSKADAIHDNAFAEKCKEIFQESLIKAGQKLPDGEKEYFDNFYNEMLAYENKVNTKTLPYELKEYGAAGGPAVKLAEKYAKKDMISAHKELTAELTPSVRNSLSQFNRYDIDTVFLRGIVKDLESTGTGADEKTWYEKLGKWHKGNTKTYDDMLKSIKTYISMAEANEDGKKVLMYQNKMIDSIKKYISGKETIRSHKFGQKRFDDVLHILSQVMPSQEFEREIIIPINEARHKAGDFDNDIDYTSYEKDRNHPGADSEYAKMRRLGLEGMDEIQKKTQENVNEIPEEFKTRWLENVLEATLSQKPVQTIEMVEQFAQTGHSYYKDFKPINDKFKSIGMYTREDMLSNKDFVAIAYLGSDTHVEYLTSEKSPKHPVGKYAKKFEEGRQKAAEALRQYEAGDKEPLAKLIAEGIKRITKGYQNRTGLQENLIAKSEMMMRGMNIMERDPELMRLAMDKNVGGLTKTDLANMKGVMRGAEVVSRAMEAKKKLDSHQDMTKEEKINALTDVDTYTIMNYSMISHHQDPKRFQNSWSKKNYLMNGYKYNLGQALGSDKEVKELRATIKEIVKQNKMYNFSDHDREVHETDFEAHDKALGIIGKKMPQMEKKEQPAKVQKTAPKKQI